MNRLYPFILFGLFLGNLVGCTPKNAQVANAGASNIDPAVSLDPSFASFLAKFRPINKLPAQTDTLCQGRRAEISETEVSLFGLPDKNVYPCALIFQQKDLVAIYYNHNDETNGFRGVLATYSTEGQKLSETEIAYAFEKEDVRFGKSVINPDRTITLTDEEHPFSKESSINVQITKTNIQIAADGQFKELSKEKREEKRDNIASGDGGDPSTAFGAFLKQFPEMTLPFDSKANFRTPVGQAVISQQVFDKWIGGQTQLDETVKYDPKAPLQYYGKFDVPGLNHGVVFLQTPDNKKFELFLGVYNSQAELTGFHRIKSTPQDGAIESDVLINSDGDMKQTTKAADGRSSESAFRLLPNGKIVPAQTAAAQ